MLDPVQNSYQVIKPYAYENTTKPVHSKGEVNGTQFDGNGTLSGASLGSTAGPYGAAIGAAVGLATDLWRAHFSKQSAERANEEAKKAADAAYARNAAEARAAREWNSEQSQIRRMRMAGMSPGLAYGQMSPSTAQPATADQQDVSKADMPQFHSSEEFLKALQLLIAQQQADTAAAAQASNASLQGSQTQLNLIDALTRNQSNLAAISEILSRKDLTDAQKIENVTLLAGKQQIQNAEVENLNASARNANANAAVVEQTGVRAAESEISKNLASASLSKQQEKSLKLEYNINNQQWQNLSEMLEDAGYGDLLAPVVMRVITSMSENAHVSVSTILNNLTHFSGSIMDAVMDYLGLTSESVETRTERDSFDQESSYNKGRSESSGSRSHTTTTTRKGRR
jgi:hypothetical protein